MGAQLADLVLQVSVLGGETADGCRRPFCLSLELFLQLPHLLLAVVVFSFDVGQLLSEARLPFLQLFNSSQVAFLLVYGLIRRSGLVGRHHQALHRAVVV